MPDHTAPRHSTGPTVCMKLQQSCVSVWSRVWHWVWFQHHIAPKWEDLMMFSIRTSRSNIIIIIIYIDLNWKTAGKLKESYMEVGDVLSVQGFGDRQLAWDWVDDEDPGWRLVSPRARHTVTQHPVLIPVGADLKNRQGKRKESITYVDTS